MSPLLRGRVGRVAAVLRARGRAALDHRHPPRAVVLTYHRVGPSSPNYWPMTVSEANFRDQMEYLSSQGVARALRDVVSGAVEDRGGRVPIAVTFDDGYEDNVRLALPILQRHGIPVTFFLVAGAIGSDAEFWWDDLDRMLLLPGRVPGRLRLDVGGELLEWDFGDDAVYTADRFAAHRGWRLLDPPPSARHRVYRELWERLRRLPSSEIVAVIDALRNATQTPVTARPGNRLMSHEQVTQVARLSGVDIGSHSMGHPYLPDLPPDRQSREVGRSRVVLTEIAGREIEFFSYPFGAWSAEVTAMVGRAGYKAAFSTSPRALRRGDDPFTLPRLSIDDCDAEGLERLLRPLVRRWS